MIRCLTIPILIAAAVIARSAEGPITAVGPVTSERDDVLRAENRVAWCIVPFDAKQRGPAARASMLKELGISRCAYDWRDEHVPTFEQEIIEYKKHGIEFFAFWSVHEEAFKLFQKYDLHPQIWQTLADPGDLAPEARIEAAAQTMMPLCRRTKQLGCKLGLYNHGGWGGEPANMVAVCQRLHELGQDHVGIVYNFHHAHPQIDEWADSLPQMQPYLLCVNLNGMHRQQQPKILGIGKGQHELEMIRVLVASDYDGPIGILDHREQLDARESLLENMQGLDWIRSELNRAGSGGPKPGGPKPGGPKPGDARAKPAIEDATMGRVFPGAQSYRRPPLTVEASVTIQNPDQYNILVASETKLSSDHWELFTMNGSGNLTAYLPGSVPDHVHTEAMVCDGLPHTLAMHYERTRMRLYVDGKQVADQVIESGESAGGIAGPLAIGRLVEGIFGCQGQIEWVRLSKGTRDLANAADHAVPRDELTLGYWNLSSQGEVAANASIDPIERTIAVDALFHPERMASLILQSQQHGDATRGAKVFADAKVACLTCHKISEIGGAVGPDLSTLGKDRTLTQIVESVLWPKREVKPEFLTWRILTTNGEVVSGSRIADQEDDDAVTLRDFATGSITRIAVDDIESEAAGGTVMPDGLANSITNGQLVDLIRFLSELGGDGKPLSDSLQQTMRDSATRGMHAHDAAEFSVSQAPLDAARRPHSGHPVNRDRLYDFYTKQAEHFRTQPQRPMLIGPYPGLDGGDQGHWGNQDEQTWADGSWNDAKLGSVQAGVFRGGGKTVARGVCVRLGENDELATCFNPDTLTYDAVWTGGFVSLDATRHGFVGGLRMDGELVETPATMAPTKAPDQPFRYHGFYRFGNRVVFAYRVGEVEYLDAPWSDNGSFTREVAPLEAHSLREAVSGGTAQWPDLIETKITLGSGRPYAMDTIELPADNPWKLPVFCGDHDFLADGSAMLCTMQGDVWQVSGLELGGRPSEVARWRRFASGLHHPLGLVVADGQVYVQCRDQLTRLEDKNGDGEADFYECYSNAFTTSPAGHDFICGLQRDASGNFYTASGNQGLLRITADGARVETVATGFRNPDGLGILPDGGLTVPVSEGDWTPASAICLVPPTTPQTTDHSLHFGYPGKKHSHTPELPLAYLPRGIDNSAGGQVYCASDAFGPLRHQLLHFSFGTGSWFVVLRDEVDGQVQGAVVPMTGDFASGAHRGRFSPVDGQLYVSGMSGWGSYTAQDGCFQRIRFTGDRVQVPVGFHVYENGVRVTFSSPIDPAIAGDPTQHFAQCWNYRYSDAYGSPELSTTHPGVSGHDPLSISKAVVLEDGCSLFLELADLQPVSQLHLRLHVNDDDALTCSPSGSGHDLFVTVHKLDQPFTDFDGYAPREKTVAVHPLLSDLATEEVKTLNPWQEKIAAAREIEIATGHNLTFTTKHFRVKANEPIALKLTNSDVVPHNWVLVRPATLQQVGELGNRLIADPRAASRHYIPETDAVLVYTDIVQPSGEQTIHFIAPPAAGNYPFLCTFPGHWMVMNGTMIVE